MWLPQFSFWISIALAEICFPRIVINHTKVLLYLVDTVLKAGVNLKAVFTALKIGLMEISRSHFKQYKNPPLISQTNVLGCFVNFLVIFRYIWEETVFLKRVVNLGEIRNS